jgi:hypothetical protein
VAIAKTEWLWSRVVPSSRGGGNPCLSLKIPQPKPAGYQVCPDLTGPVFGEDLASQTFLPTFGVLRTATVATVPMRFSATRVETAMACSSTDPCRPPANRRFAADDHIQAHSSPLASLQALSFRRLEPPEFRTQTQNFGARLVARKLYRGEAQGLDYWPIQGPSEPSPIRG